MTHDEALAKLAKTYAPATYLRALSFLAACPRTLDEITTHVGMTAGSAAKMVAILKDLGVVCVVANLSRGRGNGSGGPRRLYGLGSADVAPLTPAQRTRNYRRGKAIESENAAIAKARKRSDPPAPARVNLWGVPV